MIGFISTVLLVSTFGLVALRPRMPRHSSPWNLQFAVGYLINEQPFLGMCWLAAGTWSTLFARDVGSWWRLVTVGVVVVPAVVLSALAVRSRTARPALFAALVAGLGGDGVPDFVPNRSRLPILRVLLCPLVSFRVDVRRFRNLRYGAAGRGHRLDVYAARDRPHSAPVMIYLHGGGFRFGSKMLGARPLLYRLASRGWVCVSANYRLAPNVTHDEQVIDVKRVIAWIREHGEAFGADPSTVVLAGGSAGAHLASTAALTAGDERLQPGFEATDTTVSAVVAMYGYYGPVDTVDGVAGSPLNCVHGGAPPFFIIHGVLDTLVLVDDARHFAAALKRASEEPVVYAELPGTQHNFDLFHSLRFHAVTDAVESFVDHVHART